MNKIIEITDLNFPELDVYARLTEAQLRTRMETERGVFIAESPKVIELALNAGCIPLSLLMERRHLQGQGASLMARCPDIPVYTADRDVLASLTGYALTRGILCAMQRPSPRTAESLLADARRVAVLEGIVDSTNMGAIFRSAAALGMDAVLLTPTCCDPCAAGRYGSAWAPSSRYPGHALETARRTGPRPAWNCCTKTALPRQPWRWMTGRFPSTMCDCARRKNWRFFWAPKEMD